jgi:hypothetical protein
LAPISNNRPRSRINITSAAVLKNTISADAF